jgi:hypothetical protein
MTDDDAGVRSAFRTLGIDVRATGPSFRELASPTALRTARWRHRRRRGLAGVVVALLAVVAWQLRDQDSFDYLEFTEATGIDLGEVSWQAPSDFLLNVPGRDLLRTVPLVQIRTPAVAPDSGQSLDTIDSKRRSRS